MLMRTGITSPRNLAGIAQAGFTLIEIMIALTISLVLLTVLSLIFVGNGGFRQDLDRSSRLVENSGYSMERIADDFRLAGYYAEFDIHNATLPIAPLLKPDACATGLALLIAAMPIAIQGYDGGTALPASCAAILTDLRAGSDIVLIRRVDPCVAGPTLGTGCDAVTAGTAYFQASQCTPIPPAAATELASITSTDWFKLDTITTNLTLRLIDCNVAPPGTIADYHRFIVHIYFVTNNDNPGDGIPTLKLAQLGANAAGTAPGFNVIPVAEGIENLQVEYGIDTNNDGVPDVYTADPDSYGCACVTNWRNTVTAKVRMLGRTTEISATGQTDTKTYTLGLRADGVTANTFGPFGDRFKRRVYAAAVRLYNPGGRRE